MFNEKKLMKQKIVLNSDKEEIIRIYATEESVDTLIDQNYKQFFIDGTFRCVPKGLKYFFFFLILGNCNKL